MVKRFIGLFLLSVLFLYITSCFVVAGQPPTIWCPQEGVWFCDELQMQLSFEDGRDTYAIINGEEIKCGISNDRGSKYVSIDCRVLHHDSYKVGYVIFAGRCIELTENQFSLREVKTNRIYTFIRIE